MVLGCLYLPGILISLPKQQWLCLLWNCKMKAEREAAQEEIWPVSNTTAIYLLPAPAPHIPTTITTVNPDTFMIILHGHNTPTTSQALARVWGRGNPERLIWHRSEILKSLGGWDRYTNNLEQEEKSTTRHWKALPGFKGGRDEAPFELSLKGWVGSKPAGLEGSGLLWRGIDGR